MDDRVKSVCFMSLWIIAIFFLLNINTISCIVTSIGISGPDEANEGGFVNLICRAACDNGTCIYSWTSNSSHPDKVGDSYSIPAIYRNGTGVYTCTVKDGSGIPRTHDHPITVNFRDQVHPNSVNSSCSTAGFYGASTCPMLIASTCPNHAPRIIQQDGPDGVSINDSTTKIIVEGSPYEIVCTCETCHPSCSAKWRYNGGPVRDTGLLQFVDVSRKEAGQYTCRCTNTAYSKSVETNFMLTVEYPPTVTVSWNAAKKELTCVAAGNPEQYHFERWKHEEGQIMVREVPGDHTAGTDESILSLTGEKPYMDTGIYTCRVSNGIKGRTNSLIQTQQKPVVMQDKPVLVHIQSQYNVSKGSSVVILSKIYAIPSVSENDISITHSNRDVSIEGVLVNTKNQLVDVMFYVTNVTVNGTDIEIHIPEVKEEYFGNLNVGIRNTVGNITEIVTLTPQGAPDPPTNITCTPDVHSVLVSLKPGFYNGANQTFYVEYSTNRNASYWNNNTFVDAGSRKAVDYFKAVTVHGLEAETTYYFRLKGVNIHGESDYTEIFEVKTLEEPLNIAAIAGGVAAGVVVIILIVIVVVIVKRRAGRKDRNSKELVPLPNITDNSCSDQAPIIARSPYTNVDSPGNTNSVVYENTLKLNISNKDATDSAPKDKKEPIYSNTQIKIEEKPPEESHYQNYDPEKLKKEGFSAKPQSDYYNQEVKQSEAEEPESPKSPTEQPYLDMEVQPEVKEDYINTEAFKKPKLKEIAPKKSSRGEAYEAMINRRESDYVAPPPPPAKDEEDYMNLYVGRKS